MGQGGHGRVLTGRDAPVRSSTSLDEVQVPVPDDGHVVVNVRQRRPEVVARLLGLGVSSATLLTLLPEWRELINQVSERHSA